MGENDNIYFLTADLGWGIFDRHRKDFPKRALSTGAAEQAMLDIAVGLALSGKTPICYTITPFYLRAFETIRTYLLHEQHHVLLVGSGRYNDYGRDGYSHDASDTFGIFERIRLPMLIPDRKEQIPELLRNWLNGTAPAFMSLRR